MSAQSPTPAATHGCEVVHEDRPRDPWVDAYLCNEDAAVTCANCDRWLCEDHRVFNRHADEYFCEACSAYDEAH